MRSTIIIGLAPAVLILSACEVAQTDEYVTAEDQLGENARVAKATGSAITGPDGKTISQKSGSDVAVSLPKGFSLYPKAKVVSNTVTSDGAARQSTLMFQSSASPEDIAGFYKDQAQKAGMDITIDLNFDDNYTIAGDRAADGAAMTVSASRKDGAEVSTVMLNMVGKSGG
jgi:hypothetical protein